jgi:hypothetical protein
MASRLPINTQGRTVPWILIGALSAMAATLCSLPFAHEMWRSSSSQSVSAIKDTLGSPFAATNDIVFGAVITALILTQTSRNGLRLPAGSLMISLVAGFLYWMSDSGSELLARAFFHKNPDQSDAHALWFSAFAFLAPAALVAPLAMANLPRRLRSAGFFGIYAVTVLGSAVLWAVLESVASLVLLGLYLRAGHPGLDDTSVFIVALFVLQAGLGTMLAFTMRRALSAPLPYISRIGARAEESPLLIEGRTRIFREGNLLRAESTKSGEAGAAIELVPTGRSVYFKCAGQDWLVVNGSPHVEGKLWDGDVILIFGSHYSFRWDGHTRGDSLWRPRS